MSAVSSLSFGDGDGEGLIGADVTSVWLFVDGQGTLGPPRRKHEQSRHKDRSACRIVLRDPR